MQRKSMMDLENTRMLCEQILTSPHCKHVSVSSEAIKSYVCEITEADLSSETKDSSVNQNVQVEKAAVYLAYNVINFSFYPDKGSRRWFVTGANGKPIGVDDEAHAIVYCLNSAQEQGVVELHSGKSLLQLDMQSLENIFSPHKGKCFRFGMANKNLL